MQDNVWKSTAKAAGQPIFPVTGDLLEDLSLAVKFIDFLWQASDQYSASALEMVEAMLASNVASMMSVPELSANAHSLIGIGDKVERGMMSAASLHYLQSTWQEVLGGVADVLSAIVEWKDINVVIADFNSHRRWYMPVSRESLEEVRGALAGHAAPAQSPDVSEAKEELPVHTVQSLLRSFEALSVAARPRQGAAMAHVTGAADPVFAGRMADFLLTLSLVDALVQEWPQLVEDRRLPLERAANMSLEELPDAGWGVVHSLAEYAVKREMTPRGATHIRGMRDIIHACALTVREARAHPAWEEFLAAFNHSHRNTAAEYSDFQMECASRAPAAAPAYLADSYALDNKDVDWLLASLQALDSHPRLNSIIQGAKLCKGR